LERNAFKHPGDYLGMGEIHDLERAPSVVELLETVYKKGVRIAKKVFQSIADRITRHPSLPKYYTTIQPQDG